MRSVLFSAHNRVTLLHSGEEYFPALIAAIDAAQMEIYLETYIFASDDTADLIKGALIAAARRGVQVNIITDWIGTGTKKCKELQQELSEAGGNQRTFNPWFHRGISRSHRKICVVDRKTAFVGGLNINDDMSSDDDAKMRLPAPRWDFAVQIVGPLVNSIHIEAEAQWARLGPLNLKHRWDLFREARSTSSASSEDAPTLAGFVVRDNLRNRRTIQRAYLKALGAARKSVLLANPYFAPGRKLRDALSSAANRGVEVTLLLGVGQFRMQDAVAHAFYSKLLRNGVNIVEYRKTQLHAKVAVVDDSWATVGSSNYDGLSLFVNQEANVVVKDAAFSTALRKQIERAVADAVRIDPNDYANTPWYARFWYGAAYFLYQGVFRIITLGRYSE
jgi:cardiolipin synthase